MTLLVWLFRLLLLVIVIRLVMRLLVNAGSTSSSAGTRMPRSKTPERLGGALVRDPHCGTYVPKSRAITAGSGDATHYFCSVACRDAYAVPTQRRA